MAGISKVRSLIAGFLPTPQAVPCACTPAVCALQAIVILQCRVAAGAGREHVSPAVCARLVCTMSPPVCAMLPGCGREQAEDKV